jgi:hypothetical protein
MPHARVARLLLLASLVWGLVLAPFAHALSMAAAMAAAQTEAAAPCHQTDGEAPAQGDCCCHQGAVCHCAVPVALPVSLAPVVAKPTAIYAAAAEPFHILSLLPPEPPPPRRA